MSAGNTVLVSSFEYTSSNWSFTFAILKNLKNSNLSSGQSFCEVLKLQSFHHKKTFKHNDIVWGSIDFSEFGKFDYRILLFFRKPFNILSPELSSCNFSVIKFTAWKVSVFGVILVRIFPNMERYFASLRIQSKRGKIRTWITPNTDTFYSVIMLQMGLIKRT